MTPAPPPERPRAAPRPRGARALRAALALGALAAAQAAAAPAAAQAAPEPASPRGSRAGPAPSSTKAVARALANRGYALFKKGKYEEALEAFTRAEEQFHASTILIMIARTHDKLGHLVEAEEIYRRVAEEELPAYAPREFFEAQKTARAELDALTPRVPALRIAVRGPRPGDARVTVDDVEVDPATPRLVNPGEHTVIANDGVRPAVTRSLRVAEGQKEEVVLQLGPLPLSLAPAPAPPRGSVVPGAVVLGLGVVGIGVGSVTGAMALSKAGPLADACPDRVCTRDKEPEYNAARTLQTVSIISFAAGGAALAAGITLLVLRPGGSSPQPAEAPQLSLGPRWVSVRGRF